MARPSAVVIGVEQLKQDFLKLKFGMFLHSNRAAYTGEQWVVGYPDPSTFNPCGIGVRTNLSISIIRLICRSATDPGG